MFKIKKKQVLRFNTPKMFNKYFLESLEDYALPTQLKYVKGSRKMESFKNLKMCEIIFIPALKTENSKNSPRRKL